MPEIVHPDVRRIDAVLVQVRHDLRPPEQPAPPLVRAVLERPRVASQGAEYRPLGVFPDTLLGVRLRLRRQEDHPVPLCLAGRLVDVALRRVPSEDDPPVLVVVGLSAAKLAGPGAGQPQQPEELAELLGEAAPPEVNTRHAGLLLAVVGGAGEALADQDVHQLFRHAGITAPEDGLRPLDPAGQGVGGNEALLSCPAYRPEDQGDRVGLAGRVPLRLALQPLVKIVGAKFADTLAPKFLGEATGHHLEHAGHAALAGRPQVGAVLVQEGGNQIIVCALVGLLRQELLELVEGGEKRRPGWGVVGAAGEEVALAVDPAGVGFAAFPVADRWFPSLCHFGILSGWGPRGWKSALLYNIIRGERFSGKISGT